MSGQTILVPQGRLSLALWMATQLYANAKGEIVELQLLTMEARLQLQEELLPAMKHIIRVLAQPDREDATALLKIGTFAPIPINCWIGILAFSLAAEGRQLHRLHQVPVKT